MFIQPVIKTENLTHVYSPGTPFQVVSLDGISLEIAGGEFVAVIGATGSGKSTLVQHFNGTLAPTAGKVWVCGADLSEKKARREIWRKVGLVFQQPEQQIFEETVFAEVAFGLKNLGLGRDEARQRAAEALRLAGLDPEEVGGLSPFSLSDGMKRRVAVASVLAMRPQVLILDEPTAGLDPRGRRELMDRIEEFRSRQGATVVLVTHDMEEAARRAGRVIVLHRGRLAMDGPPRRVFGQVRELRGLGLDVPFPARLMHELKAAGRQVRTDVLTEDEAEEEIAGLLSR